MCFDLLCQVGLAYFGTHFFGWSQQKDLCSLEKVLTDKVKDILPDTHVMVVPAGRTDRGVSACAQVFISSRYLFSSLYSLFILTISKIFVNKCRIVQTSNTVVL